MHRLVVYPPQAARIQGLEHLVLLFKPLDEGIVELGRTIQIALERGSGKLPVLDDVNIRLSLGNRIGFGGQLHPRSSDKAFQGYLVMILQLFHVAALLPRLEAFGAAVANQPHLLRPLDHPVKVIGPDTVLILESRQAEPLAELRRNEGGTHAPARESALVRREKDDVLEIQGTRFQRSHHLQAFQRLSPERDGLAGQQFVQQPEPSGRLHVQVDVAQQVQRLHATLREVQFQQHLFYTTEFPAHVTDKVREVFDDPVILLRRSRFGFSYDRPEDKVQ